VEDCRTLLSSPAWLSVSFPLRYAQALVEARHVFERGDLGGLLAMSGINRGAFPGGFFGTKALSGGGAIIDHVVHIADALRFLTGCEYSTVYAEAGRFREVGDVEDCAQLVATTTGGAWASIDSSWSRPSGMPGGLDFVMTMWFERGRLRLDGFARRGMLVGPDGRITYEDYGQGMNERMLADWVSAIESDAPPPVPARDGAKATALALAATRSVESGQVVVVEGILD
jgi:predicted dehydrogenase